MHLSVCTPELFLIPVPGASHVFKQMGLNTNKKFQKVHDMVENLKIDWDIAKDSHSKDKKDHKP